MMLLPGMADDPDGVQAIMQLPCTGNHAVNLTLWHDDHGDPVPMTALLDDAVHAAQPPPPKTWLLEERPGAMPINRAASPILSAIYLSSMMHPREDRFAILLAAAASPVGTWPWNIAHQLAMAGTQRPY